LGLVAAVLVLREARYLARLTPHVRARIPAHFRIPSGLAPEVREGIEGCYAPVPDDRWQATHNLGNLGPAAAPAVPWLVALLADEDPGLGAVLSNPSGSPPSAPFDWSPYEELPIIGPLIKLFTRGGQGEYHFCSSSGACAALGEIGEPALESLIQALKDDLPRVRMHAAVALGNIADPRAIEPLGALLDEVLVAASHRLRVMTRGRFDLERDRTREDARRAGGLDLVVLDAYTGTSRPVNTLSGGEEFMASLSLALGLADVVQSHAGGIRLDTIFVDEGFGNLDEEALDLALQTLLQLREGGRLVGIVSHVGELRERISARLEVTTTPQGSSARFVM
jgi:hypothetical protein